MKEGFLSPGHANGSLLDSEHMPILTGFEAAVFVSGKFLSKDVEITSPGSLDLSRKSVILLTL